MREIGHVHRMPDRRSTTFQGPAPRPAAPDGTSTAGAPADARRILDLQRSAGNAAVAALLGDPVVQRDEPTGAKTIDVIFIIAKPGDQFTKDMTAYVKSTLQGQAYREVANIEDICEEATKLAAAGTKLRKVRLVSHGQTVQGGVGMTPRKEKKWRYVQPSEVKAYIKSPECRGLQAAMASDGEVEFWGCYLGGIEASGQAMADLWGKPVRSTKGEMKIGRETFAIKVKGRVVDATSSKQIPKGSQPLFRKWLLGQYQLLRSTGEAPLLKTEDEQVAHMTTIFDAGRGTIRSRVVQEKGATRIRRPGESDDAELWETVTPNR
jgi:hypothetical protein